MRGGREAGVAAVEVAMLLPLFLGMIFMILEVGRAMYLWNTVQEVTRHAARDATISDFSRPAVMDAVRQRAIFRGTPGPLFLGGGIDDTYVRIDYLWLNKNAGANDSHALVQVGTLPACPTRNVINCANNPYAATCVRFVRARLCLPGDPDACDPVPYTPLVPLLNSLFTITLPTSDTVAPAESLGYLPGAPDCP
ncbi:hypothetical protein AAKU55_002044 [Oxalobacteraceae bacterium GrIS 1.11]